MKCGGDAEQRRWSTGRQVPVDRSTDDQRLSDGREEERKGEWKRGEILGAALECERFWEMT